ncbi:MAG TPA: right-handed parallel beta-helix repeat-containing protein [Phycisphaerae bacterium]|nr:right-handed parallel beta-helix repeat-containing protein [Phycisphaerae bacterium]
MQRTMLWAVAALMLLGTAAVGATYVVDNQHPKASDENPGTEAGPWKTVQHAADTAQAGDTVYVMEGVYDELVALKNPGRPDAKITFRGMPQHSAQIKGVQTGKAAYVRIEGFRFVDRGVTVSSDHVEVVGNYFHKVRYQAVAGTATGTYVAYNRAWTPSAGFGASGANWVVVGNEVERMIHTTVECDYGRFFGRGHVFRRNYFHGTAQAEVAKSHVDGFQTWHLKGRGEKSHDMTFEDNVVYNFHQGIIARATEEGDWLGRFTIRRNIFVHGLLPNEKGAAVGLIFQNVPGIVVEHNLIGDVQWFGFSPSGTTSGHLRNNIVYKCGAWDRGSRPKGLAVDHNISLAAETKLPAGSYIAKDPMFVDPAKDNWRLREGSPAIGAGTGGSTIGPLAWPNVYVVDARHPGASDEGFGYSGRPFRTLAHAAEVARKGETIIVHGGVYRELVAPKDEGVTIRAAADNGVVEQVVVSGADLVAGWKREADGWSAPLAAKPVKLLRDGKVWTEFDYNAAARRITIKSGGDPRLHAFETVVRKHAVDLTGKSKVKVEGIQTANTLAEPVIPEGR